MADFSNQDIDAAVRMAAAEAGNQSPVGQQAVVHVAMNRANSSGKSLSDVINAPGQFEGVDNGNAAKVNSTLYNQVFNNIAPTLAGKTDDPTNGAHYFYSPKGQAAKGRDAPVWANGQPSAEIGDHKFYTDPQAQPSASDLIAKHGIPSSVGNPPASTPAPQATNAGPSVDDLIAKHGIPGGGNQTAQTPPEQTPGYQKAYSQAQQNPNTVLSGVTSALTGGNANPIANQVLAKGGLNTALNTWTFNHAPVLQGVSDALGTVIANAAHKIGLGSGAGDSAGEAYSAGRDASQAALDKFSTQHPTISRTAQTAGALSNPVNFANPELAGMSLLPKAAIMTGKAGLEGAQYGQGASMSHGQNAADTLKNMAVSGASQAPFGALGEVAPATGAAFKSPVLKTVAPIALQATGGALAGGVPAYFATHNPNTAAKVAFSTGAMAGAFGAGQARNAQKEAPEPTDMDKLAALTKVSNVLGTNDPAAAAVKLNNLGATKANSGNNTVAETLNPEHREPLLQVAGENNQSNLGPSQNVVAAKQQPAAVKGRLKTAVEQVSQSNPEQVSNSVVRAPVQEAIANAGVKEQAQQEANPASLRANADEAIGNATGIAPSEAELGWESHVQGMQAANSEKWQGIEKDEEGNQIPLTSPEHSRLLAEEPVVANAMRAAKSTLGADATVEVPNPKFNPEAKQPVTVEEVKNNYSKYSKEYLQALDKGEAPPSKTASGWATPEEIADWKNQKAGISGEPETLTVPTRKAWLFTKRNLNALVSRHGDTGAALPSHVSNVQNSEVNDLTKQVNTANKAEIPGLEEAQKASHEQYGGEEAEEHGFTISNAGRSTESPEALKARYGDLNDTQQAGLKSGYLRGMHRDMLGATGDPAAMARIATKYSNQLHSKYQDTIFNPDEKAAIQEQMQGIQDKVAAAKTSGASPIGDTIAKAKDLISGNKPNTAEFDHAYENDSNQHLYKDVYTDHLNQLVNGIRNPDGSIEPEHLSELKALVDSEGHQHIQDKLYGKDKAEQLRTAIRQEIESAKTGKEISNFKAKSPNEDNYLKEGTSTAFGTVSHAGQGLVKMAEGALTGFGLAKAGKAASTTGNLINQGNMTPGARRYLGEFLAKPSAEGEQELNKAATQMRNRKMSEATKQYGRRATASALGSLASHATANALTGVGTSGDQN